MENVISPRTNDFPITVLSTKTEKLISASLNARMILPTDNGLLKDWRGLAELFGINNNLLENQSNPAEKLLQMVQHDKRYLCTIHEFLTYLEVIDRFDIIDDCQVPIDNDIRQHCSIQSEIESAVLIPETESYDAMVLYAEEDVDFAYSIVDIMEKKYKMNIFIKERDLKAGDKEVQATLSVIADKSNKLIVVLSPDFLTSPINEFFLDYAQTIAIEQKIRKIIPCMLTHCQLPKQLLGLHTLTYISNSRWGCFWNRLAESIDNNIKIKASAESFNSTQFQRHITSYSSPPFDCSKSSTSESCLQECNKTEQDTLPSSGLSMCKNKDQFNSLKLHSSIEYPTSSATRNQSAILSSSDCGATSNGKNKSHKLKVSSFLNKVVKILPVSDKMKVRKGSKKEKKIAVAI